MSDLTLNPILPVPLILLCGAVMVLATLWLYGRRPLISRKRVAILAVFRLLGLILVILFLLQPSKKIPFERKELPRVNLVAVDTSQSMAEKDVDRAMRLDAAKTLLMESGLLDPVRSDVELFQFHADASPVAAEDWSDLTPIGETTRFHQSLKTIMDTTTEEQAVNMLLLLSDGHDFELVNPTRTLLQAKAQKIPIYAIPLGDKVNARDLSVGLSNNVPYAFVKQKTKIAAMIRVVGCPNERLIVELVRGGQVVESKFVSTGNEWEVPVSFTVTEEDPGQYEYTIRVTPVNLERFTDNNEVTTFLNVVQDRIRLLLVEGQPYWDTTFLQRSLTRNDKLDLDMVSVVGRDKLYRLRNSPDRDELKVPQTSDDFQVYDVVILGKNVDRILSEEQLQALDAYVRDYSGTVLFARGQAYPSEMAPDLEPVVWAEGGVAGPRLQTSPEGSSVLPMNILRQVEGGEELLPDLLAAQNISEVKRLAAKEAIAEDLNAGLESVGAIYRQYGGGQVLVINASGIWRWALNQNAEKTRGIFERFWDQTIVNLTAGSRKVPGRDYLLQGNLANLTLGERLDLTVRSFNSDSVPQSLSAKLTHNGQAVSNVQLERDGDSNVLRGAYVPQDVGRYGVEVTLPDGTSQQLRFLVSKRASETTEVSADSNFLRVLAEGSGGAIIEPEDLPKLLETFDSKPYLSEDQQFRIEPVWDTPFFFYLVCGLFGVDWFLRRRWGLT